MIKLFVTARQCNEDGTAVTLFEDYGLGYDDKDDLLNNQEKDMRQRVFEKLEEVEENNRVTAQPF
jgi:hypothetical protein